MFSLVKSPIERNRTQTHPGFCIYLGLIFLASSTLIGCSLLQRTNSSGYSSPMAGYQNDQSSDNIQKYYMNRKLHKTEMAREELGLAPHSSLSETQASRLNERLFLKSLENRLSSTPERKQYFKFKGQMKSDRERIQFLSIPNYSAKERWVTQRGLGEDRGYSEPVVELIENKDIAVGMDPKAVLQSWGDPDNIEVAGDPMYQNERWRYSRFVSSDSGYRRQTRILYFEAGRLAGWETQ